jgi:hypothetical protein
LHAPQTLLACRWCGSAPGEALGGTAPFATCRVRIPLSRQIPERHPVHQLPPVDHGHAAHGRRGHAPHRLLDVVGWGHGDEGIPADIGQGGGHRVLRRGGGGHQHTHLLGHTILLGLGPASRTRRGGAAVRAGPVRRRTALTDMVPHAARRLPVWTLTAAPMLWSPTGRLPTAPEGCVGLCCPCGKQGLILQLLSGQQNRIDCIVCSAFCDKMSFSVGQH